ncbi:Protein MLN51 homolog [Linum grandiflorum]
MSKVVGEEVDYDSDPEEEKRLLGMRRREAASDDEEGDVEEKQQKEKNPIGLDRRGPVLSDESDDQGGAADYDYDDEESQLDGGVEEEEEEVYDDEEEEDGVGEEEVAYEVEGEEQRNTGAGGVEDDVLDMEGRELEPGMGDIGEAGENVKEEEEKKENEPFAVPTAGAFYMHDDRYRESVGGRGSRRTFVGKKLWESKDDKKWGHDKFEELTSQERHYDQGRRNSRGGFRGRGGKGRGPEQGYGRRNRSGAFSNGNTQSQAPKGVRGRGPRKYEPSWNNNSQGPSPQSKQPVEKTSHDSSGRVATAMSNLESDHLPPARKHSGLNSASPPFYPSGSSSKDAALPHKNDSQAGSTSRNVRNSVAEGSFNVKQTGSIGRGKNVSDTVGIDKLYIDEPVSLTSGKALNNVQMLPAVSSSMINSSRTSQTRAQGRAGPVAGQVGYVPTASHNQLNRISPAAQHHVVQQSVIQGRVPSSVQGPNQQLSQHSGGGSRTSSPPNSAMSENSYEHEAESTSDSGKSRSALVGKAKGSGTGQFLFGGAQVVGTSGGMGVGPGDQNFPPAFLPVMQFGGQHPGGIGVPAVGMAFPGYVSQSQHGVGNSEMTWLPVLTGPAGALGATYCPPYITVDGSYHSGQTSSLSSSSKETTVTNSNNDSKPPQRSGDEYGQQRQKPRRQILRNELQAAAKYKYLDGVVRVSIKEGPFANSGMEWCHWATDSPRKMLEQSDVSAIVEDLGDVGEQAVVMEESIIRPDLHVNVTRQSPLRPNGRTTPRNSPPYRKLNSSRTPRRDGRSSGGRLQWFRSSRIVYWLLLITLWTYLGFYVQSRWAHDNNKEEFLGFGSRNGVVHSEISEATVRRDLLGNETSLAVNNKIEVGDGKGIEVSLAKKETEASSNQTVVPRKKDKRPVRRLRRRGRGRKKAKIEDESNEPEVQELDIPKRNTSYGLLVGPFGTTEDQILGWSREKRTGTCDRKGAFARLVWSRKFVLIFHELSMTGAPLSMLELATELLSCGATVSVVVLSRKGGLMPELAKRRIKVLDDRADISFKTAIKADLVIAGSAVCTSWIDQYITRFPAGGSQIVWWIMENRREYFDRSKIVLDRVKMVVFLSESQSRQWLTWCEGESIKLRSPPAVVELSVNDELAFVAGIPCSLNSPSSSPEEMLEKKQLLRSSVRREMGLNDNDMLVMSLSSINPGKGQLLLLESAKLLAEPDDSLSNLVDKHHLRSLLQDQHHTLKVLVGSVGSKSNKIPYVKEILGFVSQHSNLSKSVLWTPSTTRVASLYSAADVYVINSQGIGETFGRVTIEAMAFGLPVVGTDAGGTKEIVEQNVTGLLHPVGRQGSRVLAENLRYLMENGEVRKEMGKNGREKVERKYLKKHMYRKFGELLYKCMQIK